MALRLHCDGCGGNVMVDSGFSGSVCRCPYCKKMIAVPPGLEQDETDPATQGTDRPDAPLSQAQADAQYAQSARTARPQAKSPNRSSKFALLAILLILVMAGGVFLIYSLLNSNNNDGDNTGNTSDDNNNPSAETITGAMIASDIKLTPPVIYCIDAGADMAKPEGYKRACDIVCNSIKSLPAGTKYKIMVFLEMTIESLEGDYLTTSSTSVASARAFLDKYKANGSTSGPLQEGMVKAIKMQPKTLILITATTVQPENIIKQAKKFKVPIVAINLHKWDDADAGLMKIANDTGGAFKAYHEE